MRAVAGRLRVFDAEGRFLRRTARVVAAFRGICLLVAMALAPASAQAQTLTLFVAASLTDLAEALVAEYPDAEPGDIVVVSGASSTLARQIEKGAPADLFISANLDWAQHVTDTRGFGAPEPLFSNTLVLVSTFSFETPPDLSQLPQLLGDQRLAIGDPDHVPAGIYAKQALQAEGIWSDVSSMLALASDVRGVLAFVAQGAAPFGIVYATDTDPRIATVIDLDPALYDPIRYYAVRGARSGAALESFMAFLSSDAARDVIAELGFGPTNDDE